MRKQLFSQHVCTHVNSRKVSPISSRALLINWEWKQPLCKAKMFNPDASTQTNSITHAPPHILQNVTHSTYTSKLCSKWVADPSQTSQAHGLEHYCVIAAQQLLITNMHLQKASHRCHLLCTLSLCVHNWSFWSCSNLISNRMPVQQHTPIQAAGSASEGISAQAKFPWRNWSLVQEDPCEGVSNLAQKLSH